MGINHVPSHGMILQVDGGNPEVEKPLMTSGEPFVKNFGGCIPMPPKDPSEKFGVMRPKNKEVFFCGDDGGFSYPY